LQHAVTEYNERALDWGIVLGDMIDIDDGDWTNTDLMLSAWRQLQAPKYYCLGNHEFGVPDTDNGGNMKHLSVYGKYGFGEKAFYSFRHKGFRFITLIGDWRYKDYHPSLPEYQVAKDYYDDISGTHRDWNSAVSLNQRAWLMDLLDESLALNEPVVCMCHDPIHNPADTGHAMFNSQEMLDILDGYPNVVMWLNGHNHSGDYAKLGTRHHLNLSGLVEGENNWYQLDFSASAITSYRAENTTTPSRIMDIRRPDSTVATPSGFAVVDVSGDAVLTWDAEAVVTSVVIQRRHITQTEVELHSTAQTLAWQTIATVAPAQSYTDNPLLDVAEYKYRIRFLGGAEGSRFSQALAIGETQRTSYVEFAAGLGTGTEFPTGNADGDHKSNALEHFYGTPVEVMDVNLAREFNVILTTDGTLGFTFSHDASTLYGWGLQLSHNLTDWNTISQDVDYKITDTELWDPPAGETTRVTVELMDSSTFSHAEDRRVFIRLITHHPVK